MKSTNPAENSSIFLPVAMAFFLGIVTNYIISAVSKPYFAKKRADSMAVFNAERDGMAKGIQVQACMLKLKVEDIGRNIVGNANSDRALTAARASVLSGFIASGGDCDRMGANAFARLTEMSAGINYEPGPVKEAFSSGFEEGKRRVASYHEQDMKIILAASSSDPSAQPTEVRP